MKQKKWILIFAAEAILCAVLAVLLRDTFRADAGVLAVPFAQLGQGLRALSLSGAAGNVAAIALYAAICLLPAAIFVRHLRRTGPAAEELCLLLLSATLFGVLYVMINPALLDRLPVPDRAFGQAVLGGLVWCELCAYGVLRLLRGAFGADQAALHRYARWGLLLLAAVYVYCASGQTVTALLARFDALYAANTDHTGLGLTKAFFILRALGDAAVYTLDVWVILAGLRLLAAREAEDGALAAEAAELTARRCRTALSVTMLLSLLLYLAQIAFAAGLRQVALEVSLPLGSIAFCLGALLLARLVQENHRLQADNDMFI